jgi:methyl-accepting chemotaxis protein
MNKLKLSNLRIGARLGAAFGVLIALMLAIVAAGLMRMGTVEDMTRVLVEDDWVQAAAASRVDTLTRANAQRTMELILADSEARRSTVKASMAAHRRDVDAALAMLDRKTRLPQARDLLARIRGAREAFVKSFERVVALAEGGAKDEALALLSRETLPALDALHQPVARLSELQQAHARDAGGHTRAALGSARLWMLGLGALALASSVVLALLITRSITRPLKRAVEVARKVATGDLSQQIAVQGRDETAQLLHASLVGIVAQVRQGSESIASATQQIASGNTDLSSRTEEQASSLEQTVASMQELADTVKQNTEHGQRAGELAESAAQVALRGGAVVGEMVQTMEAINTSSRRIADIIGVIDSIAFQTNILALNAAVEAARAGEQGRGFAVVASEVRQLAQRSADAAREIKGLIGTSVGNVDAGSRHVERAGATMDEIVVSVRRVADLMREIGQASRDQTSGIEQINQAMAQLDQVTQSNAALVEEAAAAAQAVEHQARVLVQAIGVFKLSPGAGAALALHDGDDAGADRRTREPHLGTPGLVGA